jgi:hypothetical protein
VSEANSLKNKKPFRFLRRVFYHACAEASADTVKKGNPERTLRVLPPLSVQVGTGYTLPRREKKYCAAKDLPLPCVSVKQKSPNISVEASYKERQRLTLPRFTVVPSALTGLTALFGMGRGDPRRYSHPKTSWQLTVGSCPDSYRDCRSSFICNIQSACCRSAISLTFLKKE